MLKRLFRQIIGWYVFNVYEKCQPINYLIIEAFVSLIGFSFFGYLKEEGYNSSVLVLFIVIINIFLFAAFVLSKVASKIIFIHPMANNDDYCRCFWELNFERSSVSIYVKDFVIFKPSNYFSIPNFVPVLDKFYVGEATHDDIKISIFYLICENYSLKEIGTFLFREKYNYGRTFNSYEEYLVSELELFMPRAVREVDNLCDEDCSYEEFEKKLEQYVMENFKPHLLSNIVFLDFNVGEYVETDKSIVSVENERGDDEKER